MCVFFHPKHVADIHIRMVSPMIPRQLPLILACGSDVAEVRAIINVYAFLSGDSHSAVRQLQYVQDAVVRQSVLNVNLVKLLSVQLPKAVPAESQQKHHANQYSNILNAHGCLFFANIVHFILIGTKKTGKKFSDERKKSVGDAVLVLGKIPTRIGKTTLQGKECCCNFAASKSKTGAQGIENNN